MKISFIILSLVICFGAIAQDTTHFHVFGPSFHFSQSDDPSISPMIYRGAGPALEVAYRMESDRRFSDVTVGFQYSQIRPARSAFDAQMMRLALDIDYRELYGIVDQQWKLLVGGGLLTKGVYRLHTHLINNNYQYDYATSLSLETRAMRHFGLFNRDWTFTWHGSLPVFSMYARPSYNSSFPEGYRPHEEDELKAILNSLQFGSFNRLVRFQSTTGLNYHLKNGNELRLYYRWDFYHYFVYNPFTSAIHSIGLNFKMSLSKP